MIAIKVIGIGMGEAEHLTGQARSAMNSVEVFFVLEKGSTTDGLALIRHDLCERVITSRPFRFVDLEDPRRDREATDYESAVTDWTVARAGLLGEAIAKELGDGECGGLLAWGDPAFYDSTLRVLAALPPTTPPIEIEVIPGLSSIQLLASAHRISLTRVGQAVQVTTGRRLATEGFPPGCDDVVVMLDGECSFRNLDAADTKIYWGAHLGSEQEVLISGELADVGDEIVAARVKAKERRGWVMDTYLLRRETNARS